MSAEGSLHNPAIFTGKRVAVWTVAEQYLSLAREHPCPFSYIRGHIFKFFHHCFMESSNLDLREIVAKAHTIDVLQEVTQELKKRYQNTFESERQLTNEWQNHSDIPPYVCQSYKRPEPKSIETNLIGKRSSAEENDELSNSEDILISKKKLKRMNRNHCVKEKVKSINKRILCTLCPNPKGERCDYGICRTCCRKKTFLEKVECAGIPPFLPIYCDCDHYLFSGHRFNMKTFSIKNCPQNDFDGRQTTISSNIS